VKGGGKLPPLRKLEGKKGGFTGTVGSNRREVF